MKKITALLSAIIMGCSAVPMCSSAEEFPAEFDANGDGVVSFDDIEAYRKKHNDEKDITEKMLNLFDYMVKNEIVSCDFNLDGVFDLNDAQIILSFYVANVTGNVDNFVAGEFEDYYGNPTGSQEIYDFISEFGNVDGVDDAIYGNDVDASDASFLIHYYYMNGLKGDVDFDGKVDSSDASTILLYYTLAQTDNYDNDLDYFIITCVGDMDGDGKIDASDSSKILSSYVESQTSKN